MLLYLKIQSPCISDPTPISSEQSNFIFFHLDNQDNLTKTAQQQSSTPQSFNQFHLPIPVSQMSSYYSDTATSPVPRVHFHLPIPGSQSSSSYSKAGRYPVKEEFNTSPDFKNSLPNAT
jgi:hypothetical protein